MKRHLLTLLISFLSIATLQAQITWQQQKGPYGGSVKDIILGSLGKVFALVRTQTYGNNGYFSGVGTVYVSTDNGATWTRLDLGGTGASNPSSDYVTDIETDGTAIYILAAEQNNQSDVTDLYTSTDNGVTFTLKNPSTKFHGGVMLRATTSPSSALFVYGTTAANTTSYTMWKSTNSGVTWSILSGYPANSGYVFQGFVIDATGNIFVATSGAAQIVESSDAGATFTAAATGISQTSINSIATNTAKTTVYCVAVGGQLHDDIYQLSGSTWSAITGGITDISFNTGNNNPETCFLFFTPDDSHMYFVNNYGNRDLWTRTTGLWSSAASAFVTSGSYGTLSVALASSSTWYIGSDGFGMYKTTNTLSTISSVSNGLNGVRFSSLVEANVTGTIFAGGDQLFSSGDHGQTWTNVSLGFGNYSGPQNILKATGGLLITYGGYLKKSTNNGASWGAIGAGGGTPPSNVQGTGSYDGTRVLMYSGTMTGATITLYNVAQDKWYGPITPSGMPANYGISNFTVDDQWNIFATVRDNNNSNNNTNTTVYKITLDNTSTPSSATAASPSPITYSTLGITNGLSDLKFIATGTPGVYALGSGSSGSTILSKSTDHGVTWTPTSLALQQINNGSRKLYYDETSTYSFISGYPGTVYDSQDGLNTFNSVGSLDYFGLGNVEGIKVDTLASPLGTAYSLVDFAGLYKTTTTIISPKAPASAMAVGIGYNQLTIRFVRKSTNEDSLRVERLYGSTYHTVAHLSKGTIANQKMYFTDYNLTPGTLYQYRISAINVAGISAYANVSVTTLAQTPVTIPDNRSWTAVTSDANGLHAIVTTNNVNIKYQGTAANQNNLYYVSNLVGGAFATHDGKNDGYFYEAGDVSGTGQTYVLPNSTDIRPDANGVWNSAAKTISLQWRVDAAANAGNPDKYEIITYTLNGVDPVTSSPTNSTAFVFSNNSVLVQWNAGPFDTDYKIEESPNGTSGWAQVGVTTFPVTNFVDNVTSFSAGTNYYYRVSAHNANGYSAPSATASVKFANPNFIFNPNSVVNSTNAVGAGVIWGDFDNDNYEDLIITQLTPIAGVANVPIGFRNNHAGDFTIVPNLNLDLALNLMGTAGDYDNDGKLDLFLTAAGNVNYLYKGNGNFTFTKITTSGADLSTGPNINPVKPFQTAGLATAWADYNNDGLLDLFVGTQSDTQNPDNFPNASYIFKQGPAGTFTKITTGFVVNNLGSTSGVSWSDYDKDGDVDLFTNDNSSTAQPNRLYRNDNSVTPDRFVPADSTTASKTFGSSWGDYNNDQQMDLYLSSMNGNNYLYNVSTSAVFTSQTGTGTTSTKPANVFASFSGAWGDIDNDGDLDLVVSAYGANQLFINGGVGTGVFTAVTTEKFNDDRNASIGIAFADYNRDGFLDIATSNTDPSVFGGSAPAVLSPPLQKLYTNNNAGNGNHWLECKLVGASSNKSGIGARLILTTATNTQVREVSTQTGFASENSLLVHFGAGSNASITNLQIRWPKSQAFPAGLVQNMAPSNVPLNHLIIINEDGTAPDTVQFTPLNKAHGIAITTPVGITFDDSITTVSAKNITISVHGGSAVFTKAVTLGSLSTDHKTITFTPTPVLAFLTQYDVVVDAGAFTDKYGNATPAISWTFTTLDNVPPVITFTPPATMDIGTTTPFDASITDNSGTVSSATLHYRKISGGSFSTLAGTVDGTTVNQWDFSVSSSFPDGMGLEYWITAKDPDNNVGRFPSNATSDSTLYFYLNYPLAQSVIPSSVFGLGGGVSNWKIFTIPFDLGVNSDVSAVFDEIATTLTEQTDWRMVTYTNSTAWAQYPDNFSSFTRGTGYFINFRSAPVPIKIGDIVAPSNNRKNLFQLSLKQGWNEIGNPYPVPISWTDVTSYNALTGNVGQLKTFTSGTYGNGSSLQPFEGGFVFADAAAMVSIPFSGQTAPGGRVDNIVSSDIGQQQWQVNLQLQQDGIVNNLSGVGMRPNALQSKDPFDDINPPRWIDYLEMEFPHPEFFAKSFSVDVVPTQSNYTWNFSVNSNLQGAATINWDNSEFGNSAKELFLFDVAQQKVIDMKQESRYSFDPGESNQFRIYYGENLNIKPDWIQLGKAYPNPTNGKTNVTFTLPDQVGNFQVKLDVYDMLGRKVATIAEGSFPTGFYNAEWNTTESNLGNGIYIYRLAVSGLNRQDVQSGKIVLSK